MYIGRAEREALVGNFWNRVAPQGRDGRVYGLLEEIIDSALGTSAVGRDE